MNYVLGKKIKCETAGDLLEALKKIPGDLKLKDGITLAIGEQCAHDKGRVVKVPGGKLRLFTLID